MAKWIYGFAILAIMTAGIFAILKFGWEPSPVGIMKPSFFERPEQVGAVTYRRFYGPIELYKLVVVGVPPAPEWQKEIVRGMLETAANEHSPFDVMIEDPEMPALETSGLLPAGLAVEKISMNTTTQSDFVERVQTLQKAGKRVLVYTASVFSTHILPDNPVDRYEKTTGQRLFTITSGPLSMAADQEHLIDPVCVGSERDTHNTAPLGCAMLKAGRGLYRKKLKEDRYTAIMIAPKPEDYLLMVAAPGQGADHEPTAVNQ